MKTIVGIDLGTTNTVVSVVIDGRPIVIRTSEDLDYIPSVVCYDTQNGEFYVGQYAKNWAEHEPQNTVYSVKRLMGMHYFDERPEDGSTADADYQKFLAVKENVGYRLVGEPQCRDAGVRILLGGRHYLTPEDVSARILRRAKEEAERFLNTKVTGAVITHPAYFEEKQIHATRKAGELAGFEFIRTLEEPTAAAISVGLRKLEENRHVLVYDLGGGTFDVSLLQVQQAKFRVKNLGGDNWLGGDNFDDELVAIVARHINETHHYDPSVDPVFRSRLKSLVEEAKKTLTDEDHAIINAFGIANVPTKDGRRGNSINIRGLRITRAQFEEAIAPYLDKTLKDVKTVLAGVDLQPDLIREVLLVGGSTYIPCIRQMMEAQFPDKVLSAERVHPMHCVAEGAALYAHEIAKESSTPTQVPSASGIPIQLKTGRSLGIAIQAGDNDDVFEIIIPRGTWLPMKEPLTQNLKVGDSRRICVPVYAGEEPLASQNRHQGNIDLDMSHDPVATGTPVKVGLRLTDERLVEVTIKVQGRDPVVNTLRYGEDPPDETWKENLDQTICMLLEFVEQYQEYMSEETATRIRDTIARAEAASDADNRREGERLHKRLLRELFHVDEVANLLFKAERLEHRPELNQPLKNTLSSLCQLAKTAYRQNKARPTPEAEESLRDLRKRMEVAIVMAIRALPRVVVPQGGRLRR